MERQRFIQIQDIAFPRTTKTFIAVWRKLPDSDTKVFIQLVEKDDLALNDYVFCDLSFFGFGQIIDFVKNPDGHLSDYIISNARITYEKSIIMAEATRSVVDNYLLSTNDHEASVIICLKAKIEKKS
jgi:hypothetical protein